MSSGIYDTIGDVPFTSVSGVNSTMPTIVTADDDVIAINVAVPDINFQVTFLIRS